MKTKAIALVMSALVLNLTILNVEAVQIRGARSCGIWIKEQDTTLRSVNITWLLGYLSALAVKTNKDFLTGIDNDSINLWVDNYCQANPLNNIADAGDALVNELTKKKGLQR